MLGKRKVVHTDTSHFGYCASGKICYIRESSAWTIAEEMQEKYGENFYAYFHPSCTYYHVGRLRKGSTK